jgi:hypothetical protein
MQQGSCGRGEEVRRGGGGVRLGGRKNRVDWRE